MVKTLTKSRRLLFGATRHLLRRPNEAWLLCRMAWWVAVVSVAARYYSLPGALRIVSARTARGVSEFSSNAQIDLARTLDLVLSANVLMYRPICWKRAAVLHRFLSLKGIPSLIRFGVRTDPDGSVNGHAWLESEGQAILEKAPPDYIVTYTFPADQSFAASPILFSHNEKGAL